MLIAVIVLLSAYSFLVTVGYLHQRYIADNLNNAAEDNYNLQSKVKELTADRDQLAQDYKEAQGKLDAIKLTRDPKTGRMVGVKK